MPEQNTAAQSIEQQRARFALEQVQAITGQQEEESRPASYLSEFKSYANALPALIHMNGFGQAVAFCRAKANGTDNKAQAYAKLYALLQAWLCTPKQPYEGHDKLLDAITFEDMNTYRHAQIEAIALLTWVKKFANAFIEKEKNRANKPKRKEADT